MIGPGTSMIFLVEAALPRAERFENLGIRSYLFCMGLDLLGGIFRKMESTRLSCSFSSGGKPCEDEESMVGAEGELCGFVPGRLAASAPLDQVCRI